jgi:hypothetical protein
MTETDLRALLAQEAVAWAERAPEEIVADLAGPRTYTRGAGATWHEFEVTLPEANNEYIHVQISVHDGSLALSLKPFTTSFLIYRDGRIEM